MDDDSTKDVRIDAVRIGVTLAEELRSGEFLFSGSLTDSFTAGVLKVFFVVDGNLITILVADSTNRTLPDSESAVGVSADEQLLDGSAVDGFLSGASTRG